MTCMGTLHKTVTWRLIHITRYWLSWKPPTCLQTRPRSGNLARLPKVRTMNCGSFHGTNSQVGDASTIMIYATGLRNLNHSPDGRFLFGDHYYYKTARMVCLDRHLSDAVPVPTADFEDWTDTEISDAETIDVSDDGYTNIFKTTSTELSLPRRNLNSIRYSNTITLTKANGAPELSTIRSYADGAVVFKRLSPNANDERCLFYLPNHTSATTTVTMLHDSTGSPPQLQAVLTNDFQDSYTWDNPQNLQPARIVTRPVHSVHQYKLPSVPNAIVSTKLSCEVGSFGLPQLLWKGTKLTCSIRLMMLES